MRRLRIIVFDDEEPILSLFREFFPASDYDVLTCREPVVCPFYDHRSDSCPALSPCADVVITDFKMPGMDGVRLLREQVRMGCALSIKNKAIISGHFNEAVREEIRAMGYVFFQKPLRFSAIRQWLRECRDRTDLSTPLHIPRKEARQAARRERARMIGRNDELLEGIALNMSDSGLCLELKAPLWGEHTVCVDSHIPRPCRTATVRWVRQQEDGLYIAGLNYC